MARRARRTATPPPRELSSQKRRGLAGVAALVAIAFAAYIPALHGGVLWDDVAHITKPALRSWSGLYHIWFTPMATQQYYPMLHTAFWVEWQLWQGSTFAQHVINVAQHALAACLLWGILRRLQVPGAYMAAAIFAVHPVNVESVAWITEQKNTLSILFYLGAAWCYLIFEDSPPKTHRLPWGDVTTRPPGWYAAAFGLFVMALLTKTVVATLPAALLVIGWWRHGRITWKRDVLPLVPWLTLGAAAGLVTALYERLVIGAQGTTYDLDLVQRCLLAGRVVWFYFHTLLWPADLIFFYPRWVIDASDWTWWVYPIGVCATVAALAVVGVRFGRRAPLAAVLFFIGSLFPALGFLNVYPFRYSYVADHFQYQAALGIITLFSGGLFWFAGIRPAWRYRVYACAVAIVAALGWLTWKQSDQYGHDAIHHYRATLARNPASWLAYENWAAELINTGQYEEAVRLLNKALELNPEFFEALRDAGTSYERLDRMAVALPYYERASRLDPDPKRGENLYGNALLRNRQVDAAIQHLQKAIDLSEQEKTPIFQFYIDLGRAYVTAGRLDDAVRELRLAKQRAGSSYPLPEADVLLGDTLVRLGRHEEAIPHLRRAIEVDPSDAIHRFDLGRILFNAGQYDEACSLLAAAIQLRPDLVDAYIVLALGQVKLGRAAEARETAVAALKVAAPLLDAKAIHSIEETLAPILGAPTRR